VALKGLILAGGSGTRLFPLTLVTNKHLLPVFDRPMIFYPLETLRQMGVRDAMIVVGGRSVGDILELLHDGSEFGMELTYRYQRGALGIAHALGLARSFAGKEPIAVVLGDNILQGSLRGFANKFMTSSVEAGVVLKHVDKPERFGVAELGADGQVVNFKEKPRRPKSNLIPIGVYLFRPSVFDVLHGLKPSRRGEFEITDVLNEYIRRGSLMSYRYEDVWQDAGTIESLLASSALAASFSPRVPMHTEGSIEDVAAEQVDPSSVKP
jgi:glucose-1-phosphate thymidylyltransferase